MICAIVLFVFFCICTLGVWLATRTSGPKPSGSLEGIESLTQGIEDLNSISSENKSQIALLNATSTESKEQLSVISDEIRTFRDIIATHFTGYIAKLDAVMTQNTADIKLISQQLSNVIVRKDIRVTTLEAVAGVWSVMENLAAKDIYLYELRYTSPLVNLGGNVIIKSSSGSIDQTLQMPQPSFMTTNELATFLNTNLADYFSVTDLGNRYKITLNPTVTDDLTVTIPTEWEDYFDPGPVVIQPTVPVFLQKKIILHENLNFTLECRDSFFIPLSAATQYGVWCVYVLPFPFVCRVKNNDAKSFALRHRGKVMDLANFYCEMIYSRIPEGS